MINLTSLTSEESYCNYTSESRLSHYTGCSSDNNYHYQDIKQTHKYFDIRSRSEAMAELTTVHPRFARLIDRRCMNEIGDVLHWTDGEYGPRMLSVFSRVLGYTLIATMTLSQIPQIVKLLRKRSASGISTFSILLMLEASTATVAYAIQKGFPVRYSERLKASLTFLLIYIILVLVLLWPSVPSQLLWSLYACSMPAIFVSRALQMIKNHQSKDPGQLSATSSFLCIFQGFGRLTTSILTTCDDVMIYTFAAVSVLNVLLFVQVLYYRRRLKKLK